MLDRYLTPVLLEDLQNKMVFVGGPRQVGKTTLGKHIAGQYFNESEYLNWDILRHQGKILNLQFSPDTDLVILDEIHKYKNWKNHVKGFYDDQGDRYKVLVTGSARLDLYRKGGDSMIGRYHYHRLHPISYAEAAGYSSKFDVDDFEENLQLRFNKPQPNLLNDLMMFGGFPELFLKKNKRLVKRWQNERKTRLVKEDIRDIEFIREFSLFQILTNLLPTKVGSVFSLNSLREDLNMAHQTLAKWVDILENFYYCFRIYPYQTTEIKSLKKEPKLYLWDYSELSDLPAKFENLVASHLLKFVHHLYDAFGMNIELKYLRDIDQREVDFVVVLEDKPIFMVETKLSSRKATTPVRFFKRKLDVPFAFQVVLEENVDYLSQKENVRIISASKFLGGLI
ncbi:MAG: ATP-binding protein [Proteobacteria bacterium]|nr:ATP-binding protein [Pseudomonadota bacterium]